MLSKIRVMSLFAATRWRPDPQEHYAVISIVDRGAKARRLPRHPGYLRRLIIHADDVTPADEILGRERLWYALTPEQAAEIAKFAVDIRDAADVLLLHCVAGLSRSPAVAQAIAEAFSIEDLDILSQDAIPNRHMLKLVRDAFLLLPGTRD